MATLIEERRSRQPPTKESIPFSDPGGIQGLFGSANLGARESVIGVGVELGYRAWLGNEDRRKGLESVTQDEFKQQYEGAFGFDYKENETPSQLTRRHNDWIQEQVQQRRAQGVGGVGQFVMGSLANTLIDAPLMFIPYVKVAHSVSVGAKVVLQGQKISAASRTVEALSSNKLSTKLIQGALAGEDTPLKAGETFFQLTKLGAMEQTIENTAVYFGSQVLGRDYGALDASADTVFGAGILTVLGGFQTRKLMKIGNMMARDITNAKALSLLADGGDIQAVVKHLNNYSEDVTGTFMDSVEKNPRVQAILQMDEATFNADPKARGELQEFLGRNRAGVFFSTLKGNIPFDTRLSVVDAKRKQHAQLARITEALPDFLAGKDMTGRLTSEEMKIIHETDTKLQRLMRQFGEIPAAAESVDSGSRSRGQRTMNASESDLVKRVGKETFTGVEGVSKLFKGSRYEKFVAKLISFDPTLLDGLTIRRLDPLARPDKADRSWYLHGEHRIELSSTADERILLHELLHGLTSRLIDRASYITTRGSDYLDSIKLAAENSSVPASTKKILSLYLETVEHWRQKNPDVDLSGLGSTDVPSGKLPGDIPYGLLTTHEFIAEAFSSKQFQNFLESIETKDGSNLFQKIIEAIQDIFGFKVKDRTMLKEVFRATEEMLSDTGSRKPPEMERIPDDVWVAMMEEQAQREGKYIDAPYQGPRRPITQDLELLLPGVKTEQISLDDLYDMARKNLAEDIENRGIKRVSGVSQGDEIISAIPEIQKQLSRASEEGTGEFNIIRDKDKLTLDEEMYLKKGHERKETLHGRRYRLLMQELQWLDTIPDDILKKLDALERIDEVSTEVSSRLVDHEMGLLERGRAGDTGSMETWEKIQQMNEAEKQAEYERFMEENMAPYREPATKPRKPMEQATNELEVNMEAEAARGREATEAKSKEAAKGVEERAKKVSQDPLQTAKERVEAQIEGDLATIILDTKSTPEVLLVKLGEVAETLGAEGNPVRARYVALVERIIGFKKQTRQQHDHARGVLELGTKPDLSTTGEEGFIRLAQLRKRMETEKLGEGEALREYARWLDEEQMKQALAEINNDKVLHHNDSGLRRMKTSKGKLKYLKSFTDGLQRRGVRLFGGSIQSDINAQITKDMSKLRSVFAKHGFLDELDNTIHRIDGESDIPVTERSTARREASNMFVWDLAQYYKTGEAPSHYGDRVKDFEELGEALRDTLHSQITQLNEYGAGIRFREDHLGLNYRWSDEVIRKMGFDNFRARMIKEADWDRIEESHGGMMVSSRNDKGYAEEMVAFDKEVFIRQWFEESVSPVKPQDHPSTNIARSFGKARMIHMKPEFEQQSLIDFSGHGSLGRLLQDQIRHRSEMIAVMRNLGNEPLANFDKIVRAAGIDPNVNTTRVKSGSKLDKALVASGAAERTHKMDVNHMYKTVEFLTGASDNPASHDWSFWGKSYRQLSNMAFMWTAGVSAITDVPITLLTLQQMGTDVSIPQLMGAMTRSATRRFIDKDRGELTAFFEGSGAAFDALKNAGARRLALAESNGDTFLARGSEMMFTINGVSAWTSMMQEAFVDVLTQSLARQARSGSWDPHMKMTMRSMGFTQDDFFRLSDGIVEINGVGRVGPPSFEGQDLHMKLLQFFSEYRDKAVMVPDASTQSLIRFGTQAGTWQGEAVRSVMQYASFPVAMNRVVNRMMLLNAEGRNPWTTGQMSVARTAVFMGGMLGLAYVAMTMKDLARLRGPAMPWEMNQAVLARLIDQSGIPGAFGILAGAAKDGRVSSVIAPNISTQANMLGKLYNDGFGAALYASRAYTGDGIPLFGPLITTGLAYGFQGTFAESMRIGSNFRERELNVDQWTPVPNP